MEWGPQLETLKEYAASTGVFPKALAERPKLFVKDRLVYEAYWVLHSSRQIGFSGPMPISIADIVAYFQLIDERDSNLKLYHTRLIQALDTEFLKFVERRREAFKT